MASGVKVADECIEAYQEMKLRKNEAFLTFGFSNDLEKIIVKSVHKRKANASAPPKEKMEQWQELIDDLPKDDVRYAVVDIHFMTNEGPRTKLCLLSWAPENLPVKPKMLLASSKDALKKKLVGIQDEIQATSFAELDIVDIISDKFNGTL
ncbi:hypothetical protein SNEBB_005326 [Seison nebaliae]|nr:hypothetical protein SNEBB_005326 [Seison nebaliae]